MSLPQLQTPRSPSVASFAADVARDLTRAPKRLHPKYLYDDLGSSLFAAICHLPWYRITRAETQLLHEHRGEIAAATGERVRIIELGCGTGEKLQVLLDGVLEAGNDAEVHLVDVSTLALQRSMNALAAAQVPVICHQATYEEGVVRAALGRGAREAMLVLFLGSNIGNFDPSGAVGLLGVIRAALARGDRLLMGLDLVKPVADLELAYDDPLGVTAAFNKNLLVRMNRELDANFDLAAFEHLARWNALESRVEMHLVSTRGQVVRIPAAGVTVPFAEGETIWTESSYKFEPAQIDPFARLAGFALCQSWIDEEARFALALLDAA